MKLTIDAAVTESDMRVTQQLRHLPVNLHSILTFGHNKLLRMGDVTTRLLR